MEFMEEQLAAAKGEIEGLRSEIAILRDMLSEVYESAVKCTRDIDAITGGMDPEDFNEAVLFSVNSAEDGEKTEPAKSRQTYNAVSTGRRLFEVFRLEEDEVVGDEQPGLYVYAPAGCVMVGGEKVDIEGSDDNGFVMLEVSEEAASLYGHVVSEDGRKKVVFDDQSEKDGSLYSFRLYTFGEDMDTAYCGSIVSLGGGEDYVCGEDSNIVFSPHRDKDGKRDGKTAIDVYYV